MDVERPTGSWCLTLAHLDALVSGSPPWSPGRREDDMDMDRAADAGRAAPTPGDPGWCMSEVDIFRDLDAREMDALAAAAPMRSYRAGELVHSPDQPLESLYILKEGRIRIFRLSPDGRALTTAVVEPGTIFGEMVIIGQRMHDSFAEALDDVVVCVMTKADVRRLLLGDARIAARISETLGHRLGELEHRLSDTVFKSAQERIAGTVATLAASRSGRTLGRGSQVRLTHEQVAALAGTTRETATKVLGEFAEQGLVTLGRGRITVVDLRGLRAASGD